MGCVNIQGQDLRNEGGVSDMPGVGPQPPVDYPGIYVCQACLKAAIVPEPGK